MWPDGLASSLAGLAKMRQTPKKKYKKNPKEKKQLAPGTSPARLASGLAGSEVMKKNPVEKKEKGTQGKKQKKNPEEKTKKEP